MLGCFGALQHRQLLDQKLGFEAGFHGMYVSIPTEHPTPNGNIMLIYRDQRLYSIVSKLTLRGARGTQHCFLAIRQAYIVKIQVLLLI